MKTIAESLLETIKANPSKLKDLSVALSDMLGGIMLDWKLSVLELSALWGVPPETVCQWTDEWGDVPILSLSEPTLELLGDFIGIYNLQASFFVNTKDQIDWFKNSTHPELGGDTPFAHIAKDPLNNMKIVKNMIEKKYK